MAFKIGDSVEINSKEEDSSMGTYFPATILQPLAKNNYFVQYNTLLRDDKKHPVRETVDGSKIRPSPPEIQVMNYRPGDTVDVFDDEGWKVGKLSPNCFDNKGDAIGCSGSGIRLHQEWKDDKWFLSREALPAKKD